MCILFNTLPWMVSSVTAVTLTESRQYIFWLTIKVLSALIAAFIILVFGIIVIAGYIQGENMPWYVLGIGVLSVFGGLMAFYTTLLGILFKTIADGVEAGVASAQGNDVDIGYSYDADDIRQWIRNKFSW